MAKQALRCLEVRQSGAVIVVRFTTRRILGEGPCQAVGGELSALADGESRPLLLLDFAGVERLDSAALGKLIGLHRRVKAAGGRLALCGLNPELAETFANLKLHRVLNVYAGEAEALESFP
jgi:anti-anti-sigma factor